MDSPNHNGGHSRMDKSAMRKLYRIHSVFIAAAIDDHAQLRRKLLRYRRGRAFTGSALVTALVACQPHCFTKRFYAVYFGESLFDKRYIVCLTDLQAFVDSNKSRYRWSDKVLKRSKEYFNPCDRPSGARISYLHLSDIVDEVLRKEDDVNDRTIKEQVSKPERTSSFVYGFANSTVTRAPSEANLPIARRKMNDVRGLSLPDGLDRAVFEPIKDDHLYASVDHGLGRGDKYKHMNGSESKMNEPTEANHLPSQGSFSDNEKQLMEKMHTMQQQHESVVRNYEGRINSLMTKMHELWNIAEFLEHSGTKSNNNSPVVSPEGSRKDRAPNFQSSLSTPSPCRTPTKPLIRPSVPMLPLEWKRLLLGTDRPREAQQTVWHNVKTVDIDAREVESFFALKRARSPYFDPSRRGPGVRKLLTEARSQAVNDVMRGITFNLGQVEDALQRMDFSTVSIKSLQELLLVSSNEEEIAKIEEYQMTSSVDCVPLAEAERFLYDVTRIPRLGERIRFCVFADNFYNELFLIDDQMRCARKACETLISSKPLRTFLELLLSVGNYMNGSTDQGQADGCTTNIIGKLKDVKSLNGDLNLLQYLVRRLCRQWNPAAETNDSPCPLPDSDILRRAASVSVRDCENKLREMQEGLQTTEEKMRDVRELSSFFPHARQKLDEIRNRISSTKTIVSECKDYLCWHDDMRHPSVTHHNRIFFTNWSSLLYDCKKYWSLEQRRLQRDAYKATVKSQWVPEPFVPPHATSTPMTSPIPPDPEPPEVPIKRAAAFLPLETGAKRSGPRSLGSPNSAFVTPPKRYGSLRRSAAVNAAYNSGKFHSPQTAYHRVESPRNSSTRSYSPRDSPNGSPNSPSPTNVQPELRSNPSLEVVMRSHSRSPRSRNAEDNRRHSAHARLHERAHSPVSDSYSVDQPISISDYSPVIEHSSTKMATPSRRRTIGGAMDKPPPYVHIRRHHSETDSAATTPPPVPPPPSDYVDEEDLDQFIRTKARSRSPILYLEEESSHKLEQFVTNFQRQKSDEDLQPYMRQRSFSEASTIPDQATLERRKRSPGKDSVMDYDDPTSPPQSESSAPIKPLYKASFSAGPLPRPRAQTDTSPGKNDYRSALRRVSMKNPSMFQNQILRT